MFNEREKKILKILGKKKMKLTDVAEDYFKDEDKPLYPNQTVAQSVRSIKNKCAYNNLDWTLKTKGLGRNGSIVWRVKI